VLKKKVAISRVPPGSDDALTLSVESVKNESSKRLISEEGLIAGQIVENDLGFVHKNHPYLIIPRMKMATPKIAKAVTTSRRLILMLESPLRRSNSQMDRPS